MGYELALRLREDKVEATEALLALVRSAATLGIEKDEAPAAPASAPPPGSASAPPSPKPPEEGPPATAAPAPLAPASLASQTADAERAWQIRNGERAIVRAALFSREGRPKGLDLEVAFGGSEAEFRRFFAFATRSAERLKADLFDPQLGREVAGLDVEAAVGSWQQSQTWAVDAVGNHEDPRSLMEFQPVPESGVSPRARLLFALGGGLLFLYLLIDALSRLFSDP